MRLESARDILMRRSAPKPNENWFRISNAIVDATDDSTAKVYIYDEIGYWGTSAEDFVQQLMQINQPNIEVHLNSPGGKIFDGVAIYNALVGHPASVSVYVDSLAASAASFIAQAADENKLFMARNATMMIHDGIGATYGNAKEHSDMAIILNKFSDNIADIYAQRAGGDASDWRALMQEETWFLAAEAVEAGLADSVVGKTTEEDPNDKWDMSAIFKHSGRSDSPSPEEIREKVLVNSANRGGKVADDADNKGGAGSPPAPPTPPAPPVAQPPAAPAAAAPAAATQIEFTIGGQKVTDPAAVQNYIVSLEKFQTETMVQSRKDFVANLAAGSAPKISASAIESTETFALSLTPDQFKNWQATWDAAPASSVLATHAAPTPNPSGDTGQDEDKAADRIAVLQATLQHHRNAGMKQEQVEKTDSWKELQRLTAK